MSYAAHEAGQDQYGSGEHDPYGAEDHEQYGDDAGHEEGHQPSSGGQATIHDPNHPHHHGIGLGQAWAGLLSHVHSKG